MVRKVASRVFLIVGVLASTLLLPRAAYCDAQILSAADSEEFAQFARKNLLSALPERRIGGAVLIVVRDGREFFSASYGYANVAQRIPVNVDHTMFIIASISKTFTATAVAQLADAGLLSYEDVVARRLKSVKLAAGAGEHLRIRNLLTHSTGIPDLFLGASCRSSDDCMPLARFLQERQPRARATPGSFVSYSNFSNALAGQVVEDVSGLPYGEYLRQRIFRPLGMRNTRYDVPGQPKADDPAAIQALGYELSGEQMVASARNFSMFYPAGQIAASGSDMAKYMIAQLDGAGLLSESARLDMQRIHARNAGFSGGYCWAWSCRAIGNSSVLRHGGDLRGVVSDLYLVPAARFGYFIAATGDVGPTLENFARAFTQQYLQQAPPPATANDYVQHDVPAGFIGVYQDFRFSNWDPLQLFSALSEVTVRRSGPMKVSLQMPQVVGGEAFELVTTGPDELRVVRAPAGHEISSDSKVRLQRDPHGAVRYLTFQDSGYDLVATRLAPWRQTRFKLPLAVVLLLAALVATAMALAALYRETKGSIGRRLVGIGLLLIPAAIELLFPLWFFAMLATASKWDLLYGLASLGLSPAFVLLWIAAAALPVAAVYAFLGVAGLQEPGTSQRLHRAPPT